MSDIGRPVINKYGVKTNVWVKWSNERKSIYNTIMYELRPNMQGAFVPMYARLQKRSDWETIVDRIAGVLSEKLT